MHNLLINCKLQFVGNSVGDQARSLEHHQWWLDESATKQGMCAASDGICANMHACAYMTRCIVCVETTAV